MSELLLRNTELPGQAETEKESKESANKPKKLSYTEFLSSVIIAHSINIMSKATLYAQSLNSPQVNQTCESII